LPNYRFSGILTAVGWTYPAATAQHTFIDDYLPMVFAELQYRIVWIAVALTSGPLLTAFITLSSSFNQALTIRLD